MSHSYDGGRVKTRFTAQLSTLISDV
jgi:hypothetical protein